MNDQSDIPVLTDLIEKGIEITITDLGLDQDLQIVTNDGEGVDPFDDNPALEQSIRRILDEHMELAWQEIKLAIQRKLDKP